MNLPEDFDILLVEDNPTDVELIVRALRQNNLSANFYLIRSGSEALDFIHARGAYSNRRPDNLPKVIFLDLKLPGASGTEVLKNLKGDPKTRIIPVVIFTSSAEEADLLKTYEIGVNSYIEKPVDADRFYEILSTALLYWLSINNAYTE